MAAASPPDGALERPPGSDHDRPGDRDLPTQRSPTNSVSNVSNSSAPAPTSNDPIASDPNASKDSDGDAPALPDEAPPLPDEAPPVQDDGWECEWDINTQRYYFYNRFTQESTWENPRVPEASHSMSSSGAAPGTLPAAQPVAGGYNPAIHGDYDPNADYALAAQAAEDQAAAAEQWAIQQAAMSSDPNGYTATGSFNRFTGRWQADNLRPENFNDENKSKRQLNSFFDVDRAANNHDGRSLKQERREKAISKSQLKMYQKKKQERRERRQRDWLKD